MKPAMSWLGPRRCHSTEYPLIAKPTTVSLAPYFLDWLAHPNFDDYWKRWSRSSDHYAEIQVPVFSQGAWYDIFHGRHPAQLHPLENRSWE